MWNFIKKSVAWIVIVTGLIALCVVFPWLLLVLLIVWAMHELTGFLDD